MQPGLTKRCMNLVCYQNAFSCFPCVTLGTNVTQKMMSCDERDSPHMEGVGVVEGSIKRRTLTASLKQV